MSTVKPPTPKNKENIGASVTNLLTHKKGFTSIQVFLDLVVCFERILVICSI